jgi:hypothetical protein
VRVTDSRVTSSWPSTVGMAHAKHHESALIDFLAQTENTAEKK